MSATSAALGIVPTLHRARQSPKCEGGGIEVLLARPWTLRYPTPCALARADVAQLVEHNLAKVGVAGSNPVVRSIELVEGWSEGTEHGPQRPAFST